jgi:hypothetical protein
LRRRMLRDRFSLPVGHAASAWGRGTGTWPDQGSGNNRTLAWLQKTNSQSRSAGVPMQHGYMSPQMVPVVAFAHSMDQAPLDNARAAGEAPPTVSPQADGAGQLCACGSAGDSFLATPPPESYSQASNCIHDEPSYGAMPQSHMKYHSGQIQYTLVQVPMQQAPHTPQEQNQSNCAPVTMACAPWQTDVSSCCNYGDYYVDVSSMQWVSDGAETYMVMVDSPMNGNQSSQQTICDYNLIEVPAC